MKSSLKITATLLFYFSICWAKAIEERYTEASLKIIAEAMSDSTAFNRLSYLCDTFGPRLSGSKNLEDESTDDKFLKIVKNITSKGFVRSNLEEKLVDLSDVRINLKTKN